MGTLVVSDTIQLTTELGESQIQLCFGDITTLPLEEKVDILMLSAFAGDYSPVAGTVIGSLQKRLGLDLRELSYRREMDLRTNFSCWLTEPLPQWSAFKRILCFERMKGSKMSMIETIRQMFRVFVPVFRNQETTVITSLLATGNQGYGRQAVLRVMVESAASWIMAGLPLKCLKIVIYAHEDQQLSSIFSSLKTHWNKQVQKKINTMEQIYDIFIIYDVSDAVHVREIEDKCKASKTNIAVFKQIPQFDKERVWQDKVYQTMITAKRVVAVLTQAYIDNEDCLEMFNMAICCNRRLDRRILFPLYITSVKAMPLYMSIVQYFDCRIRKEGDDKALKLQEACDFILNGKSDELTSQSESQAEDVAQFQYDVFISYSHKYPAQAVQLLEQFELHHPDLKVFFDRSELTMGSMWQHTLYMALDSCKFIVALISPTYLTSTMCQEEYNIALARYMNQSNKMIFLPVMVEEVSTVPAVFSFVKMLDGRGDKYSDLIPKILEAAVSWTTSQIRSAVIPQTNLEHFDFKSSAEQREIDILKMYTVDEKEKVLIRNRQLRATEIKVKPKVSISVSRDRVYSAVCVANLLTNHIPSAKLDFLVDENPSSLKDLESADRIIVLLSEDYLKSSTHIEELHMAIIKQRAHMERKMLYICHCTDLCDSPMFLHLLTCDVAVQDPVWKSFQKQGMGTGRKYIVSRWEPFKGGFSYDTAEYAALSKLVDDVVEGIYVEKKPEDGRIIQNLLRLQHPKETELGNFLNTTVSVNECFATTSKHSQSLQGQSIQIPAGLDNGKSNTQMEKQNKKTHEGTVDVGESKLQGTEELRNHGKGQPASKSCVLL